MKKPIKIPNAWNPTVSIWLTIKNVAERLQVSTRTIHRLIDDGDLEAIHVGRSVRISEEAFQAFLTGPAKQ